MGSEKVFTTAPSPESLGIPSQGDPEFPAADRRRANLHARISAGTSQQNCGGGILGPVVG